MNVSTPLLEPIVNRLVPPVPSAPPRVYTMVSLSVSVAVYVPTVVCSSLTVIEVVAEENAGASSTAECVVVRT